MSKQTKMTKKYLTTIKTKMENTKIKTYWKTTIIGHLESQKPLHTFTDITSDAKIYNTYVPFLQLKQ